MDVEGLQGALASHGQEHVLQFWSELDPAQQAALYSDVASVNLAQLKADHERALRGGRVCCSVHHALTRLSTDSEVVKLDDKLLPMPSELVASTLRASKADLAGWQQRGISLIAEGITLLAHLAIGVHALNRQGGCAAARGRTRHAPRLKRPQGNVSPPAPLGQHAIPHPGAPRYAPHAPPLDLTPPRPSASSICSSSPPSSPARHPSPSHGKHVLQALTRR